MSNDALNWAVSQRITSTQKLVLIVLANRADGGWRCWPSIETLAKESSLTERSVYRTIKELVHSRLILVATGSGNRNIYTLTPDTPSGDRESDVTPCQVTESQVDPDTVSPTPDTPSAQRARLPMNPKEPKENPKNFRRDEEDLDAPITASLAGPVYELPLRSKANGKAKAFPVSREHFAAWQEAYPLIDVRAELKTIKAWLVSNPGKRPASDMLRFVNAWLKRGQNDKAGQAARASPQAYTSPAQRRLEANQEAGRKAKALLFGTTEEPHAATGF